MWGLAGLAVMVLLVHWGLQSDLAGAYFAQRAELGLQQLLGRQVAIGAVHLKLLPLGVEIEEFWMQGAEPEDPPFVQVTRVIVDARVVDLRKRAITLGQVRLVEPVVDLSFFGGGKNNLPKLVNRAAKGKGLRTPIHLSIHRLAIENGEVHLVQHKMPLELTAKEVELELVGRSRTDLTGNLQSEELEITLPRANPVIGKVEIRVATDEEGVRLVKGSVEGPDLSADVRGHASWEEKEWVIEVDGRVDTDFFDRLGYLQDQIEGSVALKGGYAWSRKSWGFRADLESTELEVFDRELGDVRAVVSGDRNGLRFDINRARYAGGSLEGSVNVDTQKGSRAFEVDLIADGLDLQTVLDDQKIPVDNLAGDVSGAFDYRFPFGSAKQGQGWADLQIAADFSLGAGKIPVEGEAPLIIEQGIIRTRAARVTSPYQQLELEGFFDLDSKRGEFIYNLKSERVERLALLIPFENDEERLWLPTSGSGLLAGTLMLEPGNPSTRLEFDLVDVEAPGAAADRLQGAVDLGMEGLSDIRLELLNENAGLIVTGSAPIARADGSLTTTPFSIAIDAAAWPLAQAAPWLPFELPIDGPVSGSVRMWGEVTNPTGQVRAKVSPADFRDLEIEQVDLVLDFDPTRMQVDRLSLSSAAGDLMLSGSLDRISDALDMEVRSDPLKLSEPPFSDVVSGDLDGQVAVVGTIRGTSAAPRIVTELRADRLSLADRILSDDGSAAIRLSLAEGRIEVDGDFLGVLDLQGAGSLDTKGLDLELAVESDRLDELVLITGATVEAEFSGRLSGSVRVESELEDLDSWKAVVRLGELEVGSGDLSMQNIDPVVMNLSSAGIEIESLFLGDPTSDSELFVSGEIRSDMDKSLDLHFQSSIDARWLVALLPDLDLRTGTFDMLAVIGGNVDLPEINGQARVQGGLLLFEQLPFAIEKIDGVLLFYPDQIVVDRVDARAAGGALRAEGNLRLLEKSGAPEYRIQLSASDLRVPYPEDWLTRADAEIVISSTTSGRQIRGAVEVDQALYFEDLSLGLTQMLSGVFSRDRLEVERADEFAATTEINIAVKGTDALRIRNNLADLRGDVDFVVRGTLANPVLFGSVEIERGGTIEFGVNEYEIQRGVVTFANPYRIEPVIDASARAKIRQYDVTLNLSGTLDQLNTSFTSNPPLAELEVLSLLTGGEVDLTRRTGTGSATEADSAAEASTILAGQAASLITQRTGRLFGLDRFQVQPLTTSSGELSQTRVTIGKQLSRDLFVTYSYDPESTAQDIYRVEWNIPRSGMTLVLTQNGDESYSADVRWEKSF